MDEKFTKENFSRLNQNYGNRAGQNTTQMNIDSNRYLRTDTIIIPFENREYEFKRNALDVVSFLGDRAVDTTINLMVVNQLVNAYQIKKDKRTIYIRLKLFKGLSIADFGHFMEGKRKMVRLRITISKKDLDSGLFSKTELLSYRFINGIDIDLDLLKTFILSKTPKVDSEYKKLIIQFGEIEEKYSQLPPSQIDTYLGYIDIEKETFNKLIDTILNPV